MTRPWRVLHVVTRLELGGAQRNTLYTVDQLDRGRFATGLAWGPGGLLDREADGLEGVELLPAPDLIRSPRPLSDLRALAQIRTAIRSFQADLVHTHSSKAGILGRLAARLERVEAVVHSIHGFGFTPLQPAPVRALFLAAERAATRWTDHFIVVSEANLEEGVKLGLFERERVSLIRSGIHLEAFRPVSGGDEVRRRLGIGADERVVTQVGNFKPQKAPLDFVAMAAEVRTRAPESRFIMVGDGPLLPRARELAERLGLGDGILFPGWWDDVPALLAATDVFVLASRHEGLPRAVVEALAAGVPVVATSVDGTAEVVRPGRNGFLVPPGDVTGLAEGVCRLVLDGPLRRRMSAVAGEDLAGFDIDYMVRQQEELYQCLLGPTGS